ncbi:MAG TPA: hypothetical protein VLD62_06010 [Acidimicrobiia bacterium]|nr:hypothetical protein [Acidimicrobiia bacterium]
MDDLIKQLTDKFDFLDVDKAKQVLGTVAGFLGDKLPGPIGEQVQKFLGGDDEGRDEGGDGDGGGIMDMAKDALGGLGGFLGGSKDD